MTCNEKEILDKMYKVRNDPGLKFYPTIKRKLMKSKMECNKMGTNDYLEFKKDICESRIKSIKGMLTFQGISLVFVTSSIIFFCLSSFYFDYNPWGIAIIGASSACLTFGIIDFFLNWNNLCDQRSILTYYTKIKDESEIRNFIKPKMEEKK